MCCQGASLVALGTGCCHPHCPCFSPGSAGCQSLGSSPRASHVISSPGLAEAIPAGGFSLPITTGKGSTKSSRSLSSFWESLRLFRSPLGGRQAVPEKSRSPSGHPRIPGPSPASRLRGYQARKGGLTVRIERQVGPCLIEESCWGTVSDE